jgi:uncharacterized GH25 family protein
MFRILCATALLTAATLTADAHFVFVVPDAKDPAKAVVVFSDDLDVDDAVTTEKISKIKLKVQDAGGKLADATFVTEKHCLKVAVPGTGSRVVFGSVNYGVMQKGDDKPYLLAYHPKAVVGAIPAGGGKVDSLPAQLIPVAAGGKVKFQLVGAGGKPVADAEATVILPDSADKKKEKAKTDKDGFTKEFAGAGRYGVWVKHTDATPGEVDGKKYTEARHYATLVVDVPAK